MTLSTANHVVLIMLLAVTEVWLVNVSLRLLGRRLHRVTFWTLFLGLHAMAVYCLATPSRGDTVKSFNDLPREYALGAVALTLWAVVLVLELITFMALNFRDYRREGRPAILPGMSRYKAP